MAITVATDEDKTNKNNDEQNKPKKRIIKKNKDDILTEFFKKNFAEFPFYGGDIDNFLLNCKFAHSRRVFGKHPKNRRRLNIRDLEIGFDRFVKNKKKPEGLNPSISAMYM